MLGEPRRPILYCRGPQGCYSSRSHRGKALAVQCFTAEGRYLLRLFGHTVQCALAAGRVDFLLEGLGIGAFSAEKGVSDGCMG